MVIATARRVVRPAGAAWAVVFAAAVISLGAPAYTLFQLEVVVAHAVAALGLYLTMQVAGEFMVGHVAIVGTAAYVVGWLNVHTRLDALVTLPVALLAGALAGLLLGLPGIRLSALYLGIISFFPVFVIPAVVESFPQVTGGENGLRVRRFEFLVDAGPRGLYVVALVVLVLATLFVWNIVRSTWGTRLRALRDAPLALEAAGVDVRTTKAWVYVLSAVPASLAGWLLAYVNQVVIAGFFGLSLTLVLVAAVIVGGRRSVVGVVVATMLLSGYTQLVGPFSEFNEFGLGLLLLAVVLALPSGLDTLREVVRRRRPVVEISGGPTTERDGTPAEPAPTAGRPEARAGVVRGEPLLVATGLCKSFGGTVAVDGVDIELRAGRILGLVGPNGSGKTTVINILTGFHRADGGRVQVGDRDVAGMRPHQVAHTGVSRTFQVPRVIDELSVRRNIEVGLLAGERADGVLRSVFTGGRYGLREEQRRAAVDEVAALLRLDAGVLDAPAESLSLGTKRIVEICRSLAGGAEVICLDEPAAGLNDAEIHRLGLALTDVARSGRAVLLVEHHMRFVLDVCDEVAVLEGGTVTARSTDPTSENLPAALQRHIGVTT
ncbi:ATP-binding cassette domain-containing protein [Pseudonocardia sp. KRD-184]|uniref:ATP-binding cassette domain-containing protein n=1 Tax=Pseudonocardia oceani TaxID=2792013 RepID=A0ABS6U495_9PSEU|nr:ATP-binding cassette domain-containing protein [Pseudonocardia oceani]MBW0089861.1 ATP-binding cassette domain-containing protein [Pseudonocardia oceani]MBW0097447.1 ATP-binding cassette domain-containing protein [Pseudonocardia oceani]MBW0123773.1 ATP-binding cassette domain-containing protein [Pseudonocardia oceani]MBW0127062.1 ATP-binding cassette domain-containing protein [Pseudonocardia oceani]